MAIYGTYGAYPYGGGPMAPQMPQPYWFPPPAPSVAGMAPYGMGFPQSPLDFEAFRRAMKVRGYFGKITYE